MGLFSPVSGKIEAILSEYGPLNGAQAIISGVIKNLIPTLRKAGLDTKRLNDSVLFELTCFLFFRIDFWLYANKADIRERTAVTMRELILDVCSEAFKMPKRKIAEIFIERQAIYSELIREGRTIASFFAEIEEMITRVSKGALPSNYSRRSPLTPALIDNINAKILIRIVEEKYMPIALKMARFIAIHALPDGHRKEVYQLLGYGELERAIEHLERTVGFVRGDSSPQNLAEIHYLLGKCYSEKGDSRRAINELRLSLEHNEMHCEALIELSKLVDTDESIWMLRKAIVIDPDCFEAYDQLYSTLNSLAMRKIPMDETDFARAFDAATQLIRLRPLDAKLYLSRASLLSAYLTFRTDSRAEELAISDYDAAMKVDPFDVQTILRAREMKA